MESTSQEARERHFDWIGNVLRIRLTMIFEKGTEPENPRGVIPHLMPPDAKVAKFHLYPAGVDLFETKTAVYPVPEDVRHAPYGELVLNRRPECTIAMARADEEKPFGFTNRDGEPTFYVFLRIDREKDKSFRPLYVVVQKDNEYGYIRINVSWKGDAITLNVEEIDRTQAPRHLTAVEDDALEAYEAYLRGYFELDDYDYLFDDEEALPQ